MIRFLQGLFTIVLIVMTLGTVQAGLDRGVMLAMRELWPDPWFKVTIYDTYFAFMAFYLWVFYKERTRIKRIVWFIAIILSGNFAIATYMLIQLSRLNPRDSIEKLLLRSSE